MCLLVYGSNGVGKGELGGMKLPKFKLMLLLYSSYRKSMSKI